MELSKELFEDVIVYRMSEVGAMGPNGTLTCLKKTGESFTLDYLSEETPWPEIKKNFPGIDGCRFDGPMKNELPFISILMVGGTGEGTQINPGWKHLWLDVGNHLVIKEEYYWEVRKILAEIDNCEATFDWVEILEKNDFIGRLQQIETQYREQKAWDEAFTKKLEELNKDPEFRKKVENISREQGVQGLLDILKEYGIAIDFVTLKQYQMRRLGLV